MVKIAKIRKKKISRLNRTKSDFKRKFLLFLALIAIFLVASTLLFVNISIYQKRMELSALVEKNQKELDKISQENSQLKAKINQAKNGDYLEKIFRENLNLKEQGEKVFAFSVPKAATNTSYERAASLPESKKQQEKTGLFEKILKKIGLEK